MNRRCSGLCFDDSIIATCTHVMPCDGKDFVFYFGDLCALCTKYTFPQCKNLIFTMADILDKQKKPVSRLIRMGYFRRFDLLFLFRYQSFASVYAICAKLFHRPFQPIDTFLILQPYA